MWENHLEAGSRRRVEVEVELGQRNYRLWVTIQIFRERLEQVPGHQFMLWDVADQVVPAMEVEDSIEMFPPPLNY